MGQARSGFPCRMIQHTMPDIPAFSCQILDIQPNPDSDKQQHLLPESTVIGLRVEDFIFHKVISLFPNMETFEL